MTTDMRDQTLPDVTLNSKGEEFKKQNDNCFKKDETQPHKERMNSQHASFFSVSVRLNKAL